MAIIFSGFGSCIPEKIVDENAFLNNEFYDNKGKELSGSNRHILDKFKSITGIEQRRYASDNQVASDLGFVAAQKAIAHSGVNPEELDGVICAQNYGDVPIGQSQSDMVPSIAARIKHKLGIINPACIAFDVLFGCPGWIQSAIIASQFLKSGAAKKYLVVAAETLSRVLDPHDRDSMIYADGAAAAVLEYRDDPDRSGILSFASRSFTQDEIGYLTFGRSTKRAYLPEKKFIKMQGHRIYEFALEQVPGAMKTCFDETGLPIGDLKKILIHQANEKMDQAMLIRFYQLYDIQTPPDNVMPMIIRELGNSSVATVPTLFDMILSGQLPGHELHKGDVVLLASVGAGMNINALTYRL
jgi:3-oxoacyl-[acyl-carrier-protein] synthase-3